MPMIVPAVAAAVTWVSSATAAAVGFLAAPMVGILGEGAAIAVASSGLKLAATALGAFALNSVLAPRVGSAGSPTSFKADPSSPIRGVMGYFGTGGTQAHMRVWGKNNLMISYVTILSLGPIQGIDKFEANKLQVNFPGPNGAAAIVEPYRDKMWMTYKMGLPTDGALSPPPTGGLPAMEWTADHRTSGYAASFWTMQNNSKKASFEGGVPKPLWFLFGQKLYDPRYDSTQVAIGGSGPQRLDNWTTWAYSENPQVHALNWALGHHKKLDDGSIDRSFLLAGVGARISSIDLTTLVAGMNVSDANGWKISGEWNSQDDKWQTFAAMLQAGGSVPVHVGAKIGIMTNAPKVPVATITDNDIIGSMNVKVMASRRDRFNTVYPRYLNESQDWEYATAGAVTSEVYTDQDGGEERPKEITYNYVRLSKQAGELGAYDLANTRETLKIAFQSKPWLIGIKPGDAVLVNSPSKGLVNQKFIATARPIDIMEGTISFELRSETDSKHAWALGQADRPAPSPSLSPINPEPDAPAEGDWSIAPRPASPDGTQQPGFVITGTVPDGIGGVVFESGPTATGPWDQVYSGPPTTETLYVNGLNPGEQYWIGVTYISVKGIPSTRRVFGPYTAPDLVATTITRFPDGTVPIWTYSTASELPNPPADDQTTAWVEDEGKLYNWDESAGAWTKAVDGGDVDPGTLNNNAFVAGLRAPGLGNALPTLPDAAWPVGSMFVLTTDGKTYTNRSGVWSATIDASDISGTVPTGIPFGPSLPGSGSYDQLFLNTTDKKLYRWNGTAWTTAADGADLVANSVTTNKIAVGSITAALLGANAVTASKIAVSGFSLNPDPGYNDDVFWNWDGDYTNWYPEAPSGYFSNKYYGIWDGFFTGTEARGRWSRASVAGVVKPGATVITRVDIENLSNRTVVAGMEFYSSVGGLIGSCLAFAEPGTGFASRVSDPTVVPDGTVLIGFVMYAGPGAAFSGLVRVGGIATTEMSTGQLIVDGAITADKIAANSVTAGKIAAGAVTSNTIAAGSIQARHLTVGSFDNVIPDGGYEDITFWNESGGGAGDTLEDAGGAWTYDRFFSIRQGASQRDFYSRFFPLEPDAAYKITFRVYTYELNGTIEFTPYIHVPNYSWQSWKLSAADGYAVGGSGGAGPSDPSTYVGPWDTGDASYTFYNPPGVIDNSNRQAQFRFIVGPGTGRAIVQVRIVRVSDGSLIVNGAVTADKIAANSVTADKIVAGAVTAGKINVTDLAAINANLGEIVSGYLRNASGTSFHDLTNGRSQWAVSGYALRAGSLGSQALMWFGPDSVSIGTETIANSVFVLGTDGRIYYGGAELPLGAGFFAQSNLATYVGSRTSPGAVTTSTATITTSGQTGSVTYNWSQTGGSETWTIISPNTESTSFRVNVSTPGEIKTATFICRVTDTGSGRAYNIVVSAAAIYNV